MTVMLRTGLILSLSRLSRSGNSFIFCASYGADSRNRQRQSGASASASVAPGPPLNGTGRSPHPWHETSWYLICNGNTCHYRHIPQASSGSSQYIELCSKVILPALSILFSLLLPQSPLCKPFVGLLHLRPPTMISGPGSTEMGKLRLVRQSSFIGICLFHCPPSPSWMKPKISDSLTD